ncbi:hypothetical protein OTU49_000028 [Cherax quadricarinatus]|uniref:Protein wntless n=3 Tax=Cherax quadricarinatus TaxID=27406 RepID=A0AAW0Y6M9_CHEQU
MVVATTVTVGTLLAPSPWTHTTVKGTKCVAQHSWQHEWFWPSGDHKCDSVPATNSHETHHHNISLRHIIFAFQFPPTKQGASRWQQRLAGLLRLRLLHEEGRRPPAGTKLSLITRLGYTDGDDPHPKLMAARMQDRQISCHLRKEHKFGGSTYDCSPMPLVVLYSLYHDHYIINIKVPNIEFDHIEDLYVSFISQDGRYTKVLVALQTVFFPAVLTLLAWYIHLLWQLCWSFTYFQIMLLFLALALLLINCPWTYVTLLANCPWVIILQDLSLGFFYGTFMTFLHFLTYLYLEPVKRCPKVRTAMVQVISGYTATIFLIDVMEHAILLHNPLPFVWESLHLGLATITVLLVVAYLTYITIRVYSAVIVVQKGGQEEHKGTDMEPVSKTCEASSSSSAAAATAAAGAVGVRWREALMLVVSWLCVLLTAVEFVIKRLHDGMWIWEDIFGNLEIKNTSGLLLGVYSMWNMFTFLVLIVYPPVPLPITPQAVDLETITEREPVQQTLPHSRPPLRRQNAIDIASEDSLDVDPAYSAGGDATNGDAVVTLDVVSGDGVISSDDAVSVYLISGDSVISGDIGVNSHTAGSTSTAAVVSSNDTTGTAVPSTSDVARNCDVAIIYNTAMTSNDKSDAAVSCEAPVCSDITICNEASACADILAFSDARVNGEAALSIDDALSDIAMIDDDVSCDGITNNSFAVNANTVQS